MNGRLSYRCPPSITWVRDADQTLVVDQQTEQSWTLRSVEAAVWDLLAMGYTCRRMVSMLSLILSSSMAEAGRTFVGMLRQWQDAHVVQVSGDVDDGEPDDQRGV